MPVEPYDILLIDDHQPTAELYRRGLSHEYHVFTCGNERSALDVLRSGTIRAVVLEPSLNGNDGWHILVTIKEAHGFPAIPVIVCSTLDERGRGLSLGAAAYLVKPTLPTTLRDTLRQYIPQD